MSSEMNFWKHSLWWKCWQTLKQSNSTFLYNTETYTFYQQRPFLKTFTDNLYAYGLFYYTSLGFGSILHGAVIKNLKISWFPFFFSKLGCLVEDVIKKEDTGSIPWKRSLVSVLFLNLRLRITVEKSILTESIFLGMFCQKDLIHGKDFLHI